MVQFNKGGRPRKLDGEKMKYKVTVKMSTVEYYSLMDKSKEAGITRSEFIRRSIMNTAVVQRLTPEIHAEIRKLSGMANYSTAPAKSPPVVILAIIASCL